MSIMVSGQAVAARLSLVSRLFKLIILAVVKFLLQVVVFIIGGTISAICLLILFPICLVQDGIDKLIRQELKGGHNNIRR